MMTDNKQTILPENIRRQIDHWILRYPPEQKRSGVFEALRLVQDHNGGSLTTELMDAVAAYLDIPNIAVYEVATFYSMYELVPVGKYVINLCTNISCALRGSDEVLAHLQKKLGVAVGETTADGKYTLKEVECLGACVSPPVCQVGNKYFENLTVEKVDKLLEEWK
jgi:NADH-quinone oxidoreductase subunit E